MTRLVAHIRLARAFGRLTLRNSDRLGVAHLYFHGGTLAHVVGNSGDAEATLRDLQSWTHAMVRFERGATATGITITAEQEHNFDLLLLHLQQLGLTEAPAMPRVVEGDIVSKTPDERLLTAHEWGMLIEGTRRVSLAVAHLVGPREAPRALRAILDDCSTACPTFATLQIASSGHVQISETAPLKHMPCNELLKGFHKLFATCQRFCTPLLGERDAHRLIIQALGDLSTALVSLGVFQINHSLLASHKHLQ